MELPVQPTNRPWTREAADVRAMAVAIQANLVQLHVAEAKKGGTEVESTPGVVSPGAVAHFRETLIDRDFLKGYSIEEIHLRLQEVWGQYCLMRWVFGVNTEETPTDFSKLPAGAELRCDSVLDVKLAEIEGLFWRLRFEQRRRQDEAYVSSNSFAQDLELAEAIPATAFGTPADDATDEALLLASCEFAGMLETLRWIMDRRRRWGEEGIMEIGDRPF